MTDGQNRPISILLAAPRGFCAGVDRAIQIVEQAIMKWGAPVYVRHEIVHNRHVVERLEALGAVFVEELHQCPDDRPVIFSAHGVPKAVPKEARRREMIYVDATCPLVSKVHVEAQRHFEAGREIVLIGHAGHPEVIGTMGQLPAGTITLIETADDAVRFAPKDPDKIAFVTQTTLSVDDTAEIVSTLQRRFPGMAAPHKEDICYATTNRQAAVRQIAPECDVVLVVGSNGSGKSSLIYAIDACLNGDTARIRAAGRKPTLIVPDSTAPEGPRRSGVLALSMSGAMAAGISGRGAATFFGGAPRRISATTIITAFAASAVAPLTGLDVSPVWP